MRIEKLAMPCAALLVGGLLQLGFAAPAQAQSVNLQEIFRCVENDTVGTEECDRARTLVIDNCTVCHSFVPIVLQQFDSGAWRGLLDRHRDRVVQLNDQQVDEIHAYLTVNFNEDLPPPEVPPALLENWTDY